MHDLDEVLTAESPKTLKNSPDEINERIERSIEANVGYFKKQDHVAIKKRIEDLESEWDIEKVLKVNLSGLALSATMFSIVVDKKWAYLAAGANVFLFQQLLKGWSPPFSLLRWAGIRTIDEIMLEKNALEALLVPDDQL